MSDSQTPSQLLAALGVDPQDPTHVDTPASRRFLRRAGCRLPPTTLWNADLHTTYDHDREIVELRALMAYYEAAGISEEEWVETLGEHVNDPETMNRDECLERWNEHAAALEATYVLHANVGSELQRLGVML